MQAEAPPAMMLIEAVGAIAILCEKRALMPRSFASGQAPRSSASATEAASASRRILRNIFMFHDFAIALSERNVARLQERVEAHDAEADGALALGGIFRARHAVRRVLDELRQHVVEHAHHIFDEVRLVAPLIPGLEIERGEAAHRGAFFVAVVDAGQQRDFTARDSRSRLSVQIRADAFGSARFTESMNSR